MSEINNRFRVKKGLDVQGDDATFSNNVIVNGYITTPTLAPTENSTKVATTAFVITAINNLINGAPGALDTLQELANAMGNDPNFAATVTNQLALKAPLASPALTGTPTAPTPATVDNSVNIATTAFVKNQAYATLASPALSGTPTAPTAAVGTNSNQISTTAFVQAALAAYGVGSSASAIPGGSTASIDSVSIPTGIYQVTSSNTGTKPFSDTSGFLIVMQGVGQTLIHQMYYDDTTARVFSRAASSSVWTAWREAAYLDSPAFNGTPTAPTPAQLDNSTKLATTAFVKAAQGNAAGTANFNTNSTLSLFYLGYEIQWYGPSGGILTLPTINTIPAGYGYNIYNQGSGTLIIQVAAGDTNGFIYGGSPITSITLQHGDNIVLTGRGSNELDVTGGTGSLQFVSGAILVSPTISGTPTAPTAAPNTNSTQLATTAYADAIAALKANVSNPTFTNNVQVNGSLYSGDLYSMPFVNGGRYYPATWPGPLVGSLKIKLPAGYTDTYVGFNIDVYEANQSVAFTLRVSGYASGNTWSATSAYLAGDYAARLPNVRFGNDGTTCCIWVGELTDNWYITSANISNVHLGWNGLTNWQGAWAISLVTTFDTVKVGPQTPTKFAPTNSPAFTGRITVAGASDDGFNVLQLNGSARAANWYINNQAAGDSGVSGFGNTNGPAIAYYGSSTAGAGMLSFRTANVERARFNAAGRFLVGTASDDGASLLQVNGQVNIGGQIILPSVNGSLEIGSQTTSNTPYLDFHSSGSANDYDVRMIASGGTNGTNGVGTMTYIAANSVWRLSGTASASMTLNSSSRLLLNTNSDDGSSIIQVYPTSATGFGVATYRLGAPSQYIGVGAGPNIGTATTDNYIVSFSGTSNAKLFTLNSTTDSSNTVPTSGTVGVDLQVLGSTKFRINSAGRVLIGTTSDDGSSVLQINGIATVTTPTIGDISTKVATTSFAQQTADNSAIVYSIVFG